MSIRRRMSVVAGVVRVDDDLAPRNRSGVAERRDPVNAVAIMYVNDHLESLRAEAQANRAASLGDRPSLRDRLASSASELFRILGYEASGPAVPELRDYPYGG